MFDSDDSIHRLRVVAGVLLRVPARRQKWRQVCDETVTVAVLVRETHVARLRVLLRELLRVVDVRADQQMM